MITYPIKSIYTYRFLNYHFKQPAGYNFIVEIYNYNAIIETILLLSDGDYSILIGEGYVAT